MAEKCITKFSDFKEKFIMREQNNIQKEDIDYFLYTHLISSEYITEMKTAVKYIAEIAEITQMPTKLSIFKDYSTLANEILSAKESCVKCFIYADYVCMTRICSSLRAMCVKNIAEMTAQFLNFSVAMSVAQRRIAVNKNNDADIKAGVLHNIQKHKQLCIQIEKTYKDFLEADEFCRCLYVEHHPDYQQIICDEIKNDIITETQREFNSV
jgi:hypothetical protein